MNATKWASTMVTVGLATCTVEADVLWTENFNYPNAASSNLEVTSGGVWNTDASENFTTRNFAETFSTARDPDPGTKRGGTGGTGGNIFATRPLGASYTS